MRVASRVYKSEKTLDTEDTPPDARFPRGLRVTIPGGEGVVLQHLGREVRVQIADRVLPFDAAHVHPLEEAPF